MYIQPEAMCKNKFLLNNETKNNMKTVVMFLRFVFRAKF